MTQPTDAVSFDPLSAKQVKGRFKDEQIVMKEGKNYVVWH
jgi:hypothetical protein